MNEASQALLVFSDLDGSLLDHHSYSFEAALPALETLSRHGVPLILVSSKTCEEIRVLREALGNTHPFIVENGAAVYIPRDYFPEPCTGTRRNGDDFVYEMAPPRDRWLALLSDLQEEFPGKFESFESAGVTGVMAMTGLGEAEATAASARSYSEPVRWLGEATEETRFIERLQEAGATVSRGGRFLAVSGDCDKGRALCWLRDQYRAAYSLDKIQDLAIGDSDNDRAMLEVAGTALLIRSPVHEFPRLEKTRDVIHSSQPGPAGWSEGVTRWLESINFPP